MSQNYVWPAISVTATNPSVGVNGLVGPAQSTQVGGQDQSGNLQPLQLDSSKNLLVNVSSAVLPTGAATSANQTNGNQITQVSSLPALPAGSNNIGSITNITGTVSLPTGASTSANQVTGNNSLSTISGQLPASLGQKVSTASLAVVIASDQSAVPIKAGTGTLTDGSGSTSATPNTSTQIFASNGSRKYLLIQNLDTVNTIYINFTSSASNGTGSYTLGPLGVLAQESSYISTEVVNVASTVASVNFTAKQG